MNSFKLHRSEPWRIILLVFFFCRERLSLPFLHLPHTSYSIHFFHVILTHIRGQRRKEGVGCSLIIKLKTRGEKHDIITCWVVDLTHHDPSCWIIHKEHRTTTRVIHRITHINPTVTRRVQPNKKRDKKCPTRSGRARAMCSTWTQPTRAIGSPRQKARRAAPRCILLTIWYEPFKMTKLSKR